MRKTTRSRTFRTPARPRGYRGPLPKVIAYDDDVPAAVQTVLSHTVTQYDFGDTRKAPIGEKSAQQIMDEIDSARRRRGGVATEGRPAGTAPAGAPVPGSARQALDELDEQLDDFRSWLIGEINDNALGETYRQSLAEVLSKFDEHTLGRLRK
jgi:hypothetical protein